MNIHSLIVVDMISKKYKTRPDTKKELINVTVIMSLPAT